MKKIISTCIALMVSAACSISAFAMEVPTNTTIQDLNGVRQYIKIYTVAPDTDPQSLIDDVFEYDGYHDLRTEDVAMDEIEQDAEKKLKSFSALSQDVFQSFYSLVPRRNEEASLSVAARKFNAPILEHMTKSEEYPTLKEVCEGRELPAYEAASEFVSKVSGELGDLLPQLAGKQGALHTLEKLEQAEQQAARRLYELLEQRGAIRRDDPVLDEAVVKAANEADGKHRQVEAVTKLIDDSALHGRETTHAMVREAVADAAEKAKKVQSTYTVIKRLGEKGVLQNDNGTITSLVSKDAVQAYEIGELVEKTFEGSLPAFVAAFTKHQNISEEELDEVQRMIDRIRRGGK